ncbi:MAG: FHA domain-containing protein [Myxococcales bacterium]|nr:FHA domain-containing protein [Myxococcales bacterium]
MSTLYLCADPESTGVDLRFRPRPGAEGAAPETDERYLAVPAGTFLTVGKPYRGADIELHGAPYVSGQHAELGNVNGCWTVRDLGSREGTYVNRARVDGVIPTVLYPGDRVRFARAECIVREAPCAAAVEPASRPGAA